MESFMIEKDGRTFKVYLRPDGFCDYEFIIYEIVPKKHWWSRGKVYLTHGIAWKHITSEVLDKLDDYLRTETAKNDLRREANEIANKTVVCENKAEN